MSYSFQEMMIKATQLTRAGKLQDATQAIQAALRGPAVRHPDADGPPPQTGNDVVDVPFRDLPLAQDDFIEPRLPSAGSHVFAFEGREWRYVLFKPDGAAGPMPVVLMLHGCKQDADDFARGTAMHEAAARMGCMVAYPEQLRTENGMGCWNWFEPAHQSRGSGEPAMLAALARSLAAAHGADPGRVYVAGLSAGGAMAALAAQLYPEVFAGVGIHSGLPAHAAADLVSAFAAMRKGVRADGARTPAALPTIVIHGGGDKTVHASNGRQAVASAVDAYAQAGIALHATRGPVEAGGGRRVTKTAYAAPDGRVLVEHWELAAGPHAWAGGRASGSFTDPTGPDASAAMLEFFLRHGSRASPGGRDSSKT